MANTEKDTVAGGGRRLMKSQEERRCLRSYETVEYSPEAEK